MRSKPGLRFSIMDASAIIICGVITWLLREQESVFTFMLAVVLAHFFLFCNVFRVRRKFELNWAAFFFVNVLAWVCSGRFSWAYVLLTQSPFTVLLIVLEILSPQYHGIGWQYINAKNVQAWEERNA